MAKAAQCSSPEMNNWRAESDHRTLADAAAIKGDKSRMRGVMKHQAKVGSALKTVDGDIADAGIRKTKEYKGIMGALQKKGK
jgi:hypothetical protein